MNAMNVVQTDIFGNEQVISYARKQVRPVAQKECESFSSPQEQFLFQTEQALGLKRMRTKEGYVLDARGLPLLRVGNKPFRGIYKASELSPLMKEGIVILCQNKALSKLSVLFEEREFERLLYEGLALLTLRLRKMRGNDCPYAITDVFIEHYAQQDFMSNERTGETLRNNHKRAGAEARRRAAGIKPRNFRKSRTVLSEEAEKPAIMAAGGAPLKLTVERLLGKRALPEDAYASVDDAENDRKSSDTFILDED